MTRLQFVSFHAPMFTLFICRSLSGGDFCGKHGCTEVNFLTFLELELEKLSWVQGCHRSKHQQGPGMLNISYQSDASGWAYLSDCKTSTS